MEVIKVYCSNSDLSVSGQFISSFVGLRFLGWRKFRAKGSVAFHGHEFLSIHWMAFCPSRRFLLIAVPGVKGEGG